MDKRKLAIALISLLITTSIGPSFFSLARANPLPDIEPVIKIGNPQNTTFNVNNIVVNFTASSWWDAFPIFYNLDGSDKIAVNNTKVVSEESGYWSLPVKRVTVEGSIALSGVSEGWHNLTLYMVTNKDFSLFKDYIKGDVLASNSVGFYVDSSSQTMLATATMVIVALAVGILLYKKH